VLDFSKTHLLDRLVQDYLDGKCSWLTGYEKDSAFDDVLKRRKQENFPHRELLVDILNEQNKRLNALQAENLEALLSENTFTVTTGQQLNLFTGPLYFIYKIISSINLARRLNEKYPAQLFVPIYWMASEDHDIAEVNHATIYGKKIEWKTEQTGAVGRMKCEGIAHVINEVESLLGESENANRIISLLRESYSEDHTMAEATRILVNELFGKYGLLILDADDARLKEMFKSVMVDEMGSHTTYKLVNDTIALLKQKKYHEQVHPAEVNLFFLYQNIRSKLIATEHGFRVEPAVSEIFSKVRTADIDANQYSPNVVLRTLYQETILPNIAYVGGPAEIAYWLEYRSMFDYYNISYPVLVLRNSAMIIDDTPHSKMKKLDFSPEDFFQSSDELAKQFIINNTNNFSFKEEASLITQAFNSLSQKIAGIDNTLKPAAEAEMQKNLNSLKALEEKVIRAEKKKYETTIQQIYKLKEKLFPDNTPNERIDNFLPYYVKYGEGFIEMIKEGFEREEQFYILIESMTDESSLS
jgi:bacillithiol biosynthesis cysteine-adding enzyme BshC